MMNKEAIEHIQRSANIPEVMAQSDRTDNTPIMVIPEGFSVVSLDPYMKNPSNYIMAFKTTNLDDFSVYVENHTSKDGSAVFVDGENMTANAIIDLGTPDKPLHKRHTAKLSLQKTAAFKAVKDMCENKRLAQKQAAEFLEDWHEYIDVKDTDGNDMSTFVAAAKIRTLTIDTIKEASFNVGSYSESKSSMERVEARHTNTMPGEFYFNCNTYAPDLFLMKIKVRVSLLISDNQKPVIVFSMVRPELVREQLVRAFEGVLNDKLGEYLPVYMGTTQ